MAESAISREQDLFCSCVSMPAEARSIWLVQMCGEDTALRVRIERLLKAHELADESAAPEPWDSTGDLAIEEIDGYRIVRRIGEGGMGVVYEAQQEHPIRRRVALKAVRPGMDTQQVMARFRAERQALAAMDHPFVAKVFDAGEMTSGRPFFVMEFVEGTPLLQFCHEKQLTLRARIELFVAICQAVQHAHQKGVIHRDLKPGNVLVTYECGAALPKIIDFGIARAVAAEDRSSLTRTFEGLRVGTPAYMSPEQAGRGGLDIDTRSDVYSLGVMLYELMTGVLPVEVESIPAGEFLRRLAEDELRLVRPSSCEGVPAHVRKQLAGDLDWVILKALETNRERRYDTAISMAEDLQRYLNGRPVLARAPSLSYRLRKFVRRNRLQVAAGTVALVAIAAGLVAGGAGLIQARRAEAEARQEAAAAKQVSNFLVRLFSTPDPNAAPGTPVTVQHVLEEGTRKAQTDLKGMPQTQAKLLSTLSHVHDSMGSYRQAKALAERALALRPGVEDADTADILMTIARANQRLDQFDESIRALQRAIAIRIRLTGENKYDVSAALNNLGSVYGQTGRFEEAIAAHRRALAIQQKLHGPEHIATYNSWRGLGIVYDRQGDYARALECFERVLPIARKQYGQSHPVIADAMQNVAMVLLELKRSGESQAMYRQSLAMQKKVLGPNHAETAFSLHGLAATFKAEGRLSEAEALYADALRIRLAAVGPENVRTAESMKNLGLIRVRMGRVVEGEQLLASAVRILEKAYGPRHDDVYEAHRESFLELAGHGHFLQARQFLGPVTSPETPERWRIDWADRSFDRVRSRREFRDLQTQTASAALRP